MLQPSLLLFVLLLLPVPPSSCSVWKDLNLPQRLLEFHVVSKDDLRERCSSDTECPVEKKILSSGHCWGYETNCSPDSTYTTVVGLGKCNLHSDRPLIKEAKNVFFNQGDFGYLNKRNKLHTICESSEDTKTNFQCSDSLQYCYGKNIFFKFTSFKVGNSARYRNDLIHEGEVGGNCESFYPDVIKRNLNAKSYLQSWGHELEHFDSIADFEVSPSHCDVIFERPTIIMKLDAAVNMYHHFCDFVNLYASQHINGTFTQDVDIIWWDTHYGGFVDQYFGVTWEAFSKRKPVELISLAGKRVCFKEAMLPLLARQRFGLFYNMPLTSGCAGSGLMHSFTQFLLHRLQIVQAGPNLEKIRITILQRSTQYRKMLNLKELVAAAEELPNVEIKVVDYNNKMPFKKQLESTHNSDIFIGMHGSGLTHLLFLPDWAAIFEIFNCEDEGCYYDLARLRGVKYFTWPKNKEHLIVPDEMKVHPALGTPHKKFANYHFDVSEFISILKKMIEYVRRHPEFIAQRRILKRKLREAEL